MRLGVKHDVVCDHKLQNECEIVESNCSGGFDLRSIREIGEGESSQAAMGMRWWGLCTDGVDEAKVARAKFKSWDFIEDFWVPHDPTPPPRACAQARKQTQTAAKAQAELSYMHTRPT